MLQKEKKIRKEIDKLGKERFEKIKAKNQDLSKEEKIFQEKFDKEAIKDRKETQESLREKGKERFRKAKEKREISKQEEKAIEEAEKLADEEKKKSGILYKIDDLVNSYGLKGKGVLTALGIWKIGTLEGLGLAATYEIFTRLAKSKSLQDLIKKAASNSSRDPLILIKSLNEIEKTFSD